MYITPHRRKLPCTPLNMRRTSNGFSDSGRGFPSHGRSAAFYRGIVCTVKYTGVPSAREAHRRGHGRRAGRRRGVLSHAHNAAAGRTAAARGFIIRWRRPRRILLAIKRTATRRFRHRRAGRRKTEESPALLFIRFNGRASRDTRARAPISPITLSPSLRSSAFFPRRVGSFFWK